MTFIFVSHSAHDRERIERELIGPLREHGLETWYSRQDIQAAAAWERSIREALDRCDWFLVALSPAALASEWVQTEVHWAVEHRWGRVVPVLLEPCDPTQAHLKLGRIQHIDFTNDPSAGLERLLKVWGITTGNALVPARSSTPVARPTVPQHVASSGRYLPKRTIERDYDEVVVLAHDREHGMDVLVRVRELPPESANLLTDALRAFTRLRHPSVLRVVDVFSGDGYLSIVTEATSAARSLSEIMREGVEVEVAVRIIGLLADALHYLHTKGIVHGELSPHDVVVDEQHRPVLTNLGMQARHPASEAGDERQALMTSLSYIPADVRQSNTIDARTDIWSLGAMFYELLTHRRPVEGRTPAHAPHEIDPGVPAALSSICMRCLAGEPADRYQTAADFSQALRLSTKPGPIYPPNGGWREKLQRSVAWLREHRLALLVSLLLLIGGGTLVRMMDRGGAVGTSRGGPEPAQIEGSAVRRLELLLPDSAPLVFVGAASLGVGRSALAISRDGSTLVYVAQRGTSTQLYLRHLDQIDATPLRGTEGAYQPFFSPDGTWIGFFAQSHLKKVSVNGGPPATLAAVAHPSGGSWALNDRILIADQQGTQLSWVPSGGGTPQPIARSRQNIAAIRHPELLPDGQSILHGSPDGSLSLTSLDDGRWYAITNQGVVPRENVDAARLLYGSNPRYLESGHISYISRDGVLMVLAFDLERRRVLAAPVPVLEGVRIEAVAGGAQLTVSRGGTFVYAPGANLRHSVFVWIDHATGQLDTLPFPRAAYGAFHLAPDGERILVRVEPASAPAELWLLDLAREERTRVPTTGIVGPAHWWPDGRHIVYGVVSGSAADRLSGVTVRQSLAQASKRDTLFRHPTAAVPSPKGTHFAGVVGGALKLISFPGLRDTLALPRGVGPVFSPDGRWLAYVAPEPELEVYVIPLDRPRERYKISAAGGEEPVWMPNSRGLIYRNGQQWLAVQLSTEGGFRASRPRVLFLGPYLQVPGNSHQLSPDGRRQLLLLASSEQTARRLLVVTNWLAEINRAQASEPDEQRRRNHPTPD